MTTTASDYSDADPLRVADTRFALLEDGLFSATLDNLARTTHVLAFDVPDDFGECFLGAARKLRNFSRVMQMLRDIPQFPWAQEFLRRAQTDPVCKLAAHARALEIWATIHKVDGNELGAIQEIARLTGEFTTALSTYGALVRTWATREKLKLQA